MNVKKPRYESKNINKTAIGNRIRSIRESTEGKSRKHMTQEEFYTWVTGEESLTANQTVGWWESGKTVNLDFLVDLSRKAGVSLDWLVLGDEEERKREEETKRTLRDYCRILFVDMADKFHATWSLSDESILHFAPTCGEASIRYEIPLHMVPQINEVTGYPSGTFSPTQQSRDIALCADAIKELREAFSGHHVNKDIANKAYNSILNDVPNENTKDEG